jgi:hypothetical protein
MDDFMESELADSKGRPGTVHPAAGERLRRLRQLLDGYGEDVNSYAEDCEEDLRPFFDGREAPAQWCSITRHGDRHFFYPVHHSVASAMARAREYVHDSLYEELPVAAVNLDTGARWVALLKTEWVSSPLTP